MAKITIVIEDVKQNGEEGISLSMNSDDLSDEMTMAKHAAVQMIHHLEEHSRRVHELSDKIPEGVTFQ